MQIYKSFIGEETAAITLLTTHLTYTNKYLVMYLDFDIDGNRIRFLKLKSDFLFSGPNPLPYVNNTQACHVFSLLTKHLWICRVVYLLFSVVFHCKHLNETLTGVQTENTWNRSRDSRDNAGPLSAF